MESYRFILKSDKTFTHEKARAADRYRDSLVTKREREREGRRKVCLY